MPFTNRRDAGRRLAGALAGYQDDRPVVIALPRGGVPVAAEVAASLRAPLDVLVVRKLGSPGQPELGMGAIGEGGTRVLNQDLIDRLAITDEQVEAAASAEQAEITRRLRRYRRDREAVPVRGRTVILVDDGLATGFTARAGIELLHQQGAKRVILAVPVAPADTVEDLRALADDVVCLETPRFFMAIGEWYDDFRQTSDEQVTQLLAEHARPAAGGSSETLASDEVRIRAGAIELEGTLALPASPTGAVVFAHGSGSSRHSRRNRAVASALNQAGLATLLFDLLSPEEASDRANVFAIDLLAERLAQATAWLRQQPRAAELAIGYFGASTGAAAALWAAAQDDAEIAAVVSRGGRPDLAAQHLGSVTAPTLLIVGGRDHTVLELNRQALRLLRCVNRLEIVPGATHLFEEPGALERVADLAQDWFSAYLRGDGHRAAARP